MLVELATGQIDDVDRWLGPADSYLWLMIYGGLIVWSISLVFNAENKRGALALVAINMAIIYAGLMSEGISFETPLPFRITVYCLSIVALNYGGVFYLLSKYLFQDFSRPTWLPTALIVIGFLITIYTTANFEFVGTTESVKINLFLQTANVGFVQIILLIIALQRMHRSQSIDLLENRRRFRSIAMKILAVVAVLIVGPWAVFIGFNFDSISENSFRQLATYDYLNNFRLFVALLYILVVPVAMQSRLGRLALQNWEPCLPADEADEQDTTADLTHEAQFRRLKELMEREQIYRDAGLTIAVLAEKAQTPEYILRRMINQRLGFRNFNAFLNSYRLRDAKQMLRDPSLARTPIQTIAYDLGFGSIATFNRAFKEDVGLPPSEYRASDQKTAASA